MVKVSELRNRKQTFEEALTSADSALMDRVGAEAPKREEENESLSESRVICDICYNCVMINL